MYEQILNDAIDFSFSLISFVTDVKCMGIRLKDKKGNGDYPFYKGKGYEKSFLSNDGCIKSLRTGTEEELECLCGAVIQKPKSEVKDYFTVSGSYWRNEIDNKFIGDYKELLKIKDACVDEGFESLALIPLKNKKGCKGLFHIADYIKDKFDDKKILKLEEIGRNFSQLILGVENLAVKIKKDGIKILIVEDEMTLNSLLYKMLVKCNYECYSAYNGRDAFDFLRKNRVDIVLTDINMPIMDGKELIKSIREKFEAFGPKIVVLSGYADDIDQEFEKKYNISYIIEKPVDLATLNSIIEEVSEKAM